MKTYSILIAGAQVVQGLNGGDKVSLQTTLPAPFPRIDTHTLNLEFSVERGKGKDYLMRVFGLQDWEIEIIDAHKEPMKFSNHAQTGRDKV